MSSGSGSGDHDPQDDGNPFEMVYDALWELVDQSVPMSDLVKLGNRISFNRPDDRDPLKVQISSNDKPELMLTTEGTSGVNLQSTSSSTMITRKYAWVLATGDNRLSVGKLYPVEWALLCALCDWVTVLERLTWRDKNFVTRCSVTDVSEGMSDSQRNRGIKGWSTIWKCEVRMDFSTADLKSFNTGD